MSFITKQQDKNLVPALACCFGRGGFAYRKCIAL
jgi:hypothetical protein